MKDRLSPIENNSVGRQVVRTIRDAIFSGKLALGEPLREMHLARALNVSQVSVREALLDLANIGLVVRTPNVGSTVTKLSSEEIRQRVQVRLALESLASVEASRRLTEPDYEELERRLKALSDTVERNAYFESSQADLHFHRYIWNASGNEILARTLDQIIVPLFAFVCIVRSTGTQDLTQTVQSHAPLIAALRSGDTGEIEAATKAHIERSYVPFFASGFETCSEFAQSLVSSTKE